MSAAPIISIGNPLERVVSDRKLTFRNNGGEFHVLSGLILPQARDSVR
jgi:hypothetical protein